MCLIKKLCKRIGSDKQPLECCMLLGDAVVAKDELLFSGKRHEPPKRGEKT